MKPVPLDIDFVEGDRFDFYFRVRQRTWNVVSSQWEPGAYVNLTGMRARSQIRAKAGDPNPPLATFHYLIPDQSNPLTTGGVSLWLLPTETVGYPGSAVWDVQIESDIATPTDTLTYIAGLVLISKQVTV